MLRLLLKICMFSGILFFPLLQSCKSRKEANKEPIPASAGKTREGFTKGTVIKYDVDGCTFLISLENGNRLHPVNLEEEFQKDGLKIWFRYTFQKEVMTVCMAGEVVKITAMEKAEE